VPATSAIPIIFTQDALPYTTLLIYPGLGQAPNMLACIPGGLVEDIWAISLSLCSAHQDVSECENHSGLQTTLKVRGCLSNFVELSGEIC